MGYVSDSVRLSALKHAFKVSSWTQPAAAYVALSTSAPNFSGGGVTEPVGNGYARKLHGVWIESGAYVQNSGDIIFPTATGAWGIITHFAIYTASVGGTFLGHGDLITVRSPTALDVVRFVSGEIVMRF